jgi:hypothetical protein
MNVRFAIALALSLAALQMAGAKENYHEKQINAETKEAFADISQNVRRQMDTGGKYEFVPPDERAKIDKSFGEMTALFDQYGSVSAMNQDAKVKLYNNQEIVNSILTKRDRDRVICVNQAPIGSHIRQTSCHTYAQEVQAHQETQKQMADWKVAPCVGTPSGHGSAAQPPLACSYRTNGDGGGGGRGGH